MCYVGDLKIFLLVEKYCSGESAMLLLIFTLLIISCIKFTQKYESKVGTLKYSGGRGELNSPCIHAWCWYIKCVKKAIKIY